MAARNELAIMVPYVPWLCVERYHSQRAQQQKTLATTRLLFEQQQLHKHVNSTMLPSSGGVFNYSACHSILPTQTDKDLFFATPGNLSH